VDSLFGFFGSLGRSTGKEGANSLERLVNVYSGEPDDVDVGFWNIEWFAKRYQEKLDAVATLVADLNLDIWALSESSPDAARALVTKLEERFGLKYECAFSEPGAAAGKQSTTVLWNTATVKGERRDWPSEIDGWFRVRSEQLQGLDLEAVHGKIFDRYPGLFYFETKHAQNGLGFHVVPLHLKAMDEGSLRRRMASKILASAVKKMVASGGDEDWVIGGDFNAEMATGEFQDLGGSLFPVSGEDEGQGAFTYLKSPRSLIDHIYLSANLRQTYGPNDFFIVARDHDIPDYVKRVSDHRPVLVRLSRGVAAPPSSPPPASLVDALGLQLSHPGRTGARKATRPKSPAKASARDRGKLAGKATARTRAKVRSKPPAKAHPKAAAKAKVTGRSKPPARIRTTVPVKAATRGRTTAPAKVSPKAQRKAPAKPGATRSTKSAEKPRRR
jgi:endonuclease/exonuclease/phosphatase family metal-dependent hydrolase